jgi:glycogen debranching enzyme
VRSCRRSALEEPSIDLDALRCVLRQLGRVDRLSDLGTAGPLVASAGDDSLFNCLFGRDSIVMAMDLLADFPAVARITLLELARLQGVEHRARGDEEPGRILHEFRHSDDPRAIQLGRFWDLPYYGAVDTTPLWVNLLVGYCASYGDAILDEPLVDRLWRRITIRDSLLAALAWLVKRLDEPTGAGYLWVRRASPAGIVNQVWEDSFDSYHHADGTLFDASLPFAPVAPQGYAFDALLGGASLLDRAPGLLPAETDGLRRRAETLRAKVLTEFWMPQAGTFSPALEIHPDGLKRPSRVIASSPGHLLASTLLDGDDARALRQAVAARMMSRGLLAGAGIRTKASDSVRFLAGSYHNGSTWPMDSGLIADGLRRHGHEAQAKDLEDRILRACAMIGGFPEFFRGDRDGRIRVNTETRDVVVDGVFNRLEQPPQANQGWTATRVWRILRSRGAVALA